MGASDHVMSRLTAAAGSLACLLIAAPASARAQTLTRIGFEDLTVGTRVDSQYLRQGLRLSSPAVIDTAPRAHGGRQLLVAASPPTMAALVVVSPLILGFEKPQSFVRLFLTARSPAQGRLFGTVRAYDKTGVLRAKDGPREIDPRAATVSFAIVAQGARIDFVHVEVVDSTPNGARRAVAAIDDLEFGVTPPPPPPPPPIRVPDLHGLTPEAAAARLKAVRLQMGNARDSITDQFPVNTIVHQVPARRTPVKPGTPVSVTVARPSPRAPPSRLPLILAIVAGLALGGVAAQRAWRGWRWRVGTRAHSGIESLRPRLTAPREPSLEIRLVPTLSRGTQHLRKGS
jgi:hypothetical protein